MFKSLVELDEDPEYNVVPFKNYCESLEEVRSRNCGKGQEHGSLWMPLNSAQAFHRPPKVDDIGMKKPPSFFGIYVDQKMWIGWGKGNARLRSTGGRG